MKGFRFLLSSMLFFICSFFGKNITSLERETACESCAVIVILWHRQFSFCLMHSSASQHILPLLPLFSPAWGNVLTSYHRHTCGPLQSDMPGSTHTHRGREGWDPHTNTFTCSYCSLWPVMELTHCLIWSVWNHCLTSLVKMGALGWEVEGCNIKAEVDWRRKGRVIREWSRPKVTSKSLGHLNEGRKQRFWPKVRAVNNKAQSNLMHLTPEASDVYMCSCDISAYSLHWPADGRPQKMRHGSKLFQNTVTHTRPLRLIIVCLHYICVHVCFVQWAVRCVKWSICVRQLERMSRTLGCDVLLCWPHPAVVAIWLVAMMLISVVIIIWVSMAAATGYITGVQSSGLIWKPWLSFSWDE